MNNLSWFIYLADVLSNLQPLLASVGALLAFALSFALVYGLIEEDLPFIRIGKWVVVPIILLIIACLIPSKQTIYMIAGSEAGEMVVKSEEAQQILGDIKDVIRTQLNELKK